MKRFLLAALVLALFPLQAHASAGFSCETAESEMPKLVVEGATPRSGSALINFGGTLDSGGRKIEFKMSDAKSFAWRRGGLRLRISARADGQTYNIVVDAKRNPKDEDDWAGTYEVTTAAAAAKDRAKDKTAKRNVTRGKVKCFVE